MPTYVIAIYVASTLIVMYTLYAAIHDERYISFGEVLNAICVSMLPIFNTIIAAMIVVFVVSRVVSRCTK